MPPALIWSEMAGSMERRSRKPLLPPPASGVTFRQTTDQPAGLVRARTHTLCACGRRVADAPPPSRHLHVPESGRGLDSLAWSARNDPIQLGRQRSRRRRWWREATSRQLRASRRGRVSGQRKAKPCVCNTSCKAALLIRRAVRSAQDIALPQQWPQRDINRWIKSMK